MKVLFVYERFILGGIETLMIRMKRWLERNGHEVHVLLGDANDGDYLGSLGANVTVVGSRGFHALCYPFWKVKAKIDSDFDAIFSFSKTSFAVSLGISMRMNNRIPVLSGVFGPWIFEYERGGFFDPIVKIFDRCLPDKNKIFMSEQIKYRHELSFNRRMPAARDWPLPIDVSHLAACFRSPKQGKIVSVGRLTSFKTYNLYMPDVVDRLNEKGINVEWHVYGDSDDSDLSLKEEMVARISSMRFQDKVFLHGNFEYEKMPEILSDAYCFVGMGTALVEAAACGVPAVLAVAEECEGKTYGLFSDLPHGVLGENIPGSEMKKYVFEVVFGVLSLDDAGYKALSHKMVEKARLYSIDSQMGRFLEFVSGSSGFLVNRLWFYYCCYLLKKTYRFVFR